MKSPFIRLHLIDWYRIVFAALATLLTRIEGWPLILRPAICKHFRQYLGLLYAIRSLLVVVLLQVSERRTALIE